MGPVDVLSVCFARVRHRLRRLPTQVGWGVLVMPHRCCGCCNGASTIVRRQPLAIVGGIGMRGAAGGPREGGAG